MKVGVITYHFVYNCGAALQCLALQKVLKDMGHEPVVINYRPWYMQNKYTNFKNPFDYYKNALMDSRDKEAKAAARKAFIDAAKTWRNIFKAKVNNDKFLLFRKRFISFTRTYRNIKQLKANPPDLDVYISGSDQLWNPYLTNGVPDAAYFLDFGDKKTGRMTYAIGANPSELETNKDALKPLLNNFTHISLRENKCLPLLKSICGENTDFHIDIDPTLLLDQEDFKHFEAGSLPVDEPFILLYTMPDSSAEAARHAARKLGELKGMPVIDIAMRRVKKDDKMLDPHVAGPDEFLAYMRRASYVYTNSFHGTAFSIIYRKQFMAVPHRNTGNRVTELLEKLSMQDRWRKTGGETLSVIDNPIDYERVAQELCKLKKESLAYIKSIIGRESDK